MKVYSYKKIDYFRSKIYMSGKLGNQIDNLFKGSDFISESFDFILKNFDKILMITIIFFLILSWTTIFEWEFPKKKNIILKKKIIFKEGGVKTENFESKEKVLNKELDKDCGDDKICQQNKKCLKSNDSFECSSLKNCCFIKENGKKKCVVGNKNGPVYDNSSVDEWWYLGNYYNKKNND